MIKDFEFQNAVKIYFGKDQLHNLGPELAKYGKKVLITYGGGSIKRNGIYDKAVEQIKKAGLEIYELSGIEPNPHIQTVRKGAEICKKEGIDVLLAIGGGSTIDCTKFIAAGAKVDFDPWLFLSEQVPVQAALPIVTIVTLSATGSEMDNGGVISNPDTNDKLAAGSVYQFPKASFLNPENVYTVNEYQTACGSADILSHLFEIYFSTGDNMYMLDCFMEGMMKTVIKYTPIALADPANYEARANLMWASTWAINGFAGTCSTVVWSCHPMEHELSAFYNITHGLGLAILTPRWMEYCLDDEARVNRFAQYGVNVFGIDAGLPKMDIAKKSIRLTADFLFNKLGLKSTLTEVGIGEEKLGIMAEKAVANGGLENGFKPLTPADVENIFRMCL